MCCASLRVGTVPREVIPRQVLLHNPQCAVIFHALYLHTPPAKFLQRNGVSLTLTRQTRTFLDLCTQRSAVITPGAPL